MTASADHPHPVFAKTPTEPVMYLIRHGATANNLASPPVLQGCRVDPPLSSTGHQQACAVAGLLRPFPLSAVYSSPLQRAQETALEVAKPHGVPVTVLAELREVDVGRWEGRSWDAIAQEEPEAYAQFQREPNKFGYAGGENLQQVCDRIVPVLYRLLRESDLLPCAVVAHNVVNRAFLAHLMKIPLADARAIAQHNCGVNVIRRHRDQVIVETLNATFHLAHTAS